MQNVEYNGGKQQFLQPEFLCILQGDIIFLHITETFLQNKSDLSNYEKLKFYFGAENL